MFRFTIRDVLWLMVVVGLGVGWWDANQRAMDREDAYKVWGFDIAAKLLKETTGDIITANRKGVAVNHADGRFEAFSLKDHLEQREP